MGLQEGERVMDTFKNHLHLPVTKIDDSKRMLARLKVRTKHCVQSTSLAQLVSLVILPSSRACTWPTPLPGLGQVETMRSFLI